MGGGEVRSSSLFSYVDWESQVPRDHPLRLIHAELTRAAGVAERRAAPAMAENLTAGHKTIGADKGYDTHGFVMELRELGITPHVAQNAYYTGTARHRLAIDGRTTRRDGYAVTRKSASGSRRSSAG